MKLTAGNIKTGIIVLLALLLVCAGLFGSRTINRYKKSIETLNTANYGLNQQIKLRNIDIRYQEGLVKEKDARIDSMEKAFELKDRIIAQTTSDLIKALAQLNGITSDSSYQFLQKVAYSYPGALQYLFNALQIKFIHSDYLIARNSEKIIPEYQKQIQGCRDQFVLRGSIESGLKKITDLQKLNIADCQKVNENKDTIIKDTNKALTKAERRKTFWKITTGGSAIIAIIALLGII